MAPVVGLVRALGRMVTDGVDGRSLVGMATIAYRSAVFALCLALAVPFAAWSVVTFVAWYQTNAHVRTMTNAYAWSVGPLLAVALAERHRGVIRRPIGALRRWVESFGSIDRR